MSFNYIGNGETFLKVYLSLCSAISLHTF